MPATEIDNILELEQRVDSLTKAINSCYEESCPLTRIKPDRRQTPGWNASMAELKSKVRSLEKKFVLHGTDETWEPYRVARNKYRSMLRRAKRSSWKLYCTDIESMPEASRLYKVLCSDVVVRLGPIETQAGPSLDTASTLQHLLSAHFKESDAEEEVRPPRDTLRLPISDSVVSAHRIMTAISTFSPYKAPGPDGVFPALINAAGDELVKQLCFIYRACLSLGWTPKCWREALVVFLPKSGKDTYLKSSSWRPISLTSFLLKILERLVDWEIKTPALVDKLKRNGQYAYLRGASTEAALHRLVAEIEKTLTSGELAVGVFLDIEGAFNKVPSRVIASALRRVGVDEVFVRWIISMLTDRKAVATAYGKTATLRIGAGCPQGGVLSPFLWDCVVDELLSILRERVPSALSQGFADDIGLLQRGKCLKVVLDTVQRALDLVKEWCERVELSVNAAKTEAVVFTLMRRLSSTPQLHYGGTEVPFTTKVRYLGVTIDNKLTWMPHCAERSRKLSMALAQCKRSMSAKWGLSPKLMKWIYTAVVRPALTYGSVAWVTAVDKVSNIKYLEKVQRLALLLITGALSSTPTRALEALVGVLPIRVQVRATALTTMHRLWHSGAWIDRGDYGYLQRSNHVKANRDMGKKIPLIAWPCDRRVSRPLVEGGFKTVFPSRKVWEQRGSPQHDDSVVVCYTDGSRHDGSTGAAAVISWNGERTTLRIPLGASATVFQAEVLAIRHAADALRHVPTGTRIVIYSDSKSAIQALKTWNYMTLLVGECFQSLKALATERTLELVWIPAHVGFEGNEEADEVAKEAAGMTVYGPEPIVPVAMASVRSAIRVKAAEQHTDMWRSYNGARQTKELIDVPSMRVSNYLVTLCRQDLRLFTQVITGHSTLRGHLHRMRKADSDVCPFCEVGRETSLHLLGRCDCFLTTRLDVLESQTLSAAEVRVIKPASLLKFIKCSGRFTLDTQ
ncbi:unnamed protein product [Orchesella dallaii]|uniref:Retrovirus-related Pol polyprotein from type-1 retrotransposable element R1 n=1 Tax=Orchesella dallaii TaxID=48710 RepID=A0ABP1RGQ5_9HEXA